MKKGNLTVYVYASTIATPVVNAKVSVLKNSVIIKEGLTNEDGQVFFTNLETVDKIYSLNDQEEVRPYQTYNLLIEALGLTETRINGVQIFDGITSIQNVYLTSIDDELETSKEVDENTLWEDNEPYQESVNNNGISPIVLKEVAVPPTIVVHDGKPNENAKNYTVNFTDYIKNVASSEIYTTWPTETIKANVLAIISFTLNRIYTEWYRSQGYDFTITSSPAYDQKYSINGTIFEPISNVVDEIFNNYIRSGIRLEPLLAHYKSETTLKGYLSQWGSKNLGEQGYSALQILRYYYGNDINIYNALISDSYPYSFTGVLMEGDCSKDVYILQNTLNYIHGSYPSLPIINKPSGQFNVETTAAVKSFQKTFNLPITGLVDLKTWYKISYILTAVTKMTNSIY